MKSEEELKEFRSWAESELRQKVQDLEEELMKLRFRKAVGEVRHSARLKVLRRGIARVKTVIRERVSVHV